jgi:hypothetical protein
MSSRRGGDFARARASMNIATLSAYIFSAMVTWTPLKVHFRESENEVRARYEGIARDIATVALDESEPPLFAGEDGRTQTALLIASIASFESYFRADVDAGKARGDHGVSWCMMQVQVHGKTAEGWTGQDLILDRTKCIRAGLHLVQYSFEWCKHLPLRHKLSGYTSGTCGADASSEARIARAIRWMKEHPAPVPEKVERFTASAKS